MLGMLFHGEFHVALSKQPDNAANAQHPTAFTNNSVFMDY